MKGVEEEQRSPGSARSTVAAPEALQAWGGLGCTWHGGPGAPSAQHSSRT